MGLETTISKNIRIAKDKAEYDASCRRLLSEKYILAWIMKDCMDEYRDYDVKEIAEKYIEGRPQISEIPVAQDETNGSLIHGENTTDTTVTEGTIYFDIRFFAVAPVSGELIKLIVNVEGQNDFYPGYPLVKRAFYYCSRLISSQYGVEFIGSHYEKIKKVYSIWVCMNPPNNRKNIVTKYAVSENNLVGYVREACEYYDLMTVIMICLGRPEKGTEDERYTGILKLLNVLFSAETNQETKRRVLEDEFDIPMTQKLEREVSVMCNFSEGIERTGIEKGILSAIESIMETLGLTAEQAMAALKIPEDDRQKYMTRLRK